MPDSIIGMADMEVVFSVTDGLGIDRESISVELTKEDPGSVGQDANGTIEITLPASQSKEEFSRQIEATLKDLGYTPQDAEKGEDEDDWL